jgi:choline-glycine betaine transporter
MAEKDRLAESIKYRIEWLRLLWITLLAVGSGEVSLLLSGLPTLAHTGAAIIGVPFMLVVGVIVSRLDKQARKAIEDLREV